jgi:uncharacterized delta-60 repeat protein
VLRAALAALLLAAPPGSLDRGFGHDGGTAFPAGTADSWADTVRIDPAGRVLLGGAADVPGGNALAVARLSARGRLDPGFGQGGLATPALPGLTLYRGATEKLLAAAHGATIAVGTAEDTYNSAQHVVVARLDRRGRLDPRFGHQGATVVTLPHALYVTVAGAGRDAAGRILVLATTSPDVEPPSTSVLIRLRRDGTPDAGFGTGGMVTLSHRISGDGLLVNRHGGAVALGTLPARGRRTVRAVVYRLDARGRIRGAHRLALQGRDPSVAVGPTALARGPHGSVYVAGNDTRGFTRWGWIARLRRDGRWDRRIVPVAKRRNFVIRALARDRRGRLVAAGSVGVDRGRTWDAAAMRLGPDGRVDRRFGLVVRRLGALAHVHLVSSEAFAAAVDARGRIVLAGAAYDDDLPDDRAEIGKSYFAAARLKDRP